MGITKTWGSILKGENVWKFENNSSRTTTKSGRKVSSLLQIASVFWVLKRRRRSLYEHIYKGSTWFAMVEPLALIIRPPRPFLWGIAFNMPIMGTQEFKGHSHLISSNFEHIIIHSFFATECFFRTEIWYLSVVTFIINLCSPV